MSIDNQVLRTTVIDFMPAGRKFNSFFTFGQQTQAIFFLLFLELRIINYFGI